MWINFSKDELGLVKEILILNTSKGCDLVRKINEFISRTLGPDTEKYREAAQRSLGTEDNIEIDDDAPISKGNDSGAFVQAWIWVSNEDAGITSHDPARRPR